MYAWETEKGFGGIASIEERMKIMYNEHIQSPTHSVSHYISYLRRYVSQPEEKSSTSGSSNEKQTRSTSTDREETRPVHTESQRSADSISPLSYFIRKLKLDLKMSFPSFVEEFIQPPNNGLRLLLSLLKIVQSASLNPAWQVNNTAAKGTLKMENYKQNMAAVDEILEHHNGLFIITTCLLSNFSRSRIAALEILTLVITGPSSVDKVLDAFTSMRVRYGESTRFKMLIGMMHIRGVSHVVFQVSCLRLLNTILNLSKTANMRVFLQYELEEAGFDWTKIQEGAQGDGLEYDDLRKEIREWRMRYIDVDSILGKIKADLKADYPGSALTEYHYDQHYGLASRSVGPVLHDFHAQNNQPDLRQRRHHELRTDPVFSSPSRLEESTPFLVTSNKTNMGTVKYDKPVRGELQADNVMEDQSRKRTMTDRVGLSPAMTYLPGTVRADITESCTAFNEKLEETKKNNRVSMTSEIYDPYGLLLKAHSSNLASRDIGACDKNWVLGTSGQDVRWTNSKQDEVNINHKVGQGEMIRPDTAGDQYDSGVCVNYQDPEQGDELPQICWKNLHRRSQLVPHSNDEVNFSSDGYSVNQNKEQKVQRDFVCKKDVSEQGPLQWYNPRISYLQPISQPILYQHSSNPRSHGASILIKPPTPVPDYSYDDFEVPELPFTPKLSSTVRASLKNSPARPFIRAGNVHQRYTDVTINTHSQFSRNIPTNDNSSNKENKHVSKFSQDHHESQAPPQPSPYDHKHNARSSFDNRQNPYNPLASSVHSTNMTQTILAQRTDSDFMKVPADLCHSDYSRKCHDDIRSPTSESMALSEHQTSNNVRRGSLVSKQPIDESSYCFKHLQEMSHQKIPITLRQEEKHISRSLISLTANEPEYTAQPNKLAEHEGQNVNGNNISTRRSSVSEIFPTSGRRRGSEAVTRFGSTNEIDDKGIPLKEPGSSERDSLRSYSAEIGRVLSDLDKALEKHGWQESLKQHVKQQRLPLIAYV